MKGAGAPGRGERVVLLALVELGVQFKELKDGLLTQLEQGL